MLKNSISTAYQQSKNTNSETTPLMVCRKRIRDIFTNLPPSLVHWKEVFEYLEYLTRRPTNYNIIGSFLRKSIDCAALRDCEKRQKINGRIKIYLLNLNNVYVICLIIIVFHSIIDPSSLYVEGSSDVNYHAGIISIKAAWNRCHCFMSHN